MPKRDPLYYLPHVCVAVWIIGGALALVIWKVL